MYKDKYSHIGFTLIELLVVIAIIALLLAILGPALSIAKRKAATAVCLINTKNLSLGWYMYQGDNDGHIMSSSADAVEPDGTYVGWAGEPRDASGGLFGIQQASPAVTDEDEIRGLAVGVLFDYLKSPKTYHCPADNLRKSKYDLTKVFTSYSIAACLYGWPNPSSGNYNKQIIRFGEITSPGSRYIFVETAETRNWNMNHRFIIGAPEYDTGFDEWGWWGPMAVNHGDSSVLGFTDGHSEVRKWRDPFTKERVDKLINDDVDNYGVQVPPDDQKRDINYMAAGWAYHHKL